jgi:hypothetical protein
MGNGTGGCDDVVVGPQCTRAADPRVHPQQGSRDEQSMSRVFGGVTDMAIRNLFERPLGTKVLRCTDVVVNAPPRANRLMPAQTSSTAVLPSEALERPEQQSWHKDHGPQASTPFAPTVAGPPSVRSRVCSGHVPASMTCEARELSIDVPAHVHSPSTGMRTRGACGVLNGTIEREDEHVCRHPLQCSRRLGR